MQKNVKIALIEDDENLNFLLSHRLMAEGYDVIIANDGIQGEEMVVKEQPDILLLDWMLPGRQGIEICANLRKRNFHNLIIMITAKSQDIDKIEAYNLGISDYLTKPFSMDVLMALIENKVKFAVNNKDSKDVYYFGDMEHHPKIHSLVKEGKKTELTIIENRIIFHFMQKLGVVVTREELMQAVWGFSSDINTRTLDMHIVRLRKKIEDNADKPLYLQTVRGIGYKFSEQGI